MEHRGKPGERCVSCGSKARHRIALEVYRKFLPIGKQDKTQRVLHLAPERSLSGKLLEWFGGGYITADPAPERYEHVKCLRLFFPQDYEIFPDGYVNVILHNHVLEHIPGHYKDHLGRFMRMLQPGGVMVFSVPGPYLDQETTEGGEHLNTDRERLEKFKQEDHFKLFGRDFVKYLAEMENCELISDGITDEFRQSVSVRKGKATFYILRKDQDKGQ